MKNVVQVVVGSRDVIRAPALWRYDREQYIEISGLDLPASYMAEMSNTPIGDAEQYLQTSATIHVPSKFLTSTDPVYIWLTFVDEEGRTTRREIICPVTNRGEPVDAVPTPEEQTAIEEAIAALNIAVERADEAVEHYPVITDGVWYVWDVNAAEYVSTGVSAIGPKGDKGDPGERGEKGEKGEKGDPGENPAGAVLYDATQTITDAEKAQARTNIGAADTDDVSELKSKINILEPTATSEDVGKALIAKTVSGGKVTEYEFGEAGGADPEVIEQAVTDWLDDHPEATTTVQDGSLTEAKFEADTLAALKNNYATPEMFDAKGDGTTDDSEAIQNMFDSDYNVFVFGQKRYRCCNITVEKPCMIIFNKTEFYYSDPWKVVAAEWMLAFKSSNIKTIGKLTIDASLATSVGLLIDSAVCRIDYVYVIRARIWGIYCTGSQIGHEIGSFETALCGFNVSAKAKYVSSTELALTNIHFNNDTYYSAAAKDEIFGNAYSQNMLVVDDSGYDEIKGFSSRVVFLSRAAHPITLDESDKSVGTFTLISGGGYYMPESTYVDGDDGRQVYIPVGGGIAFNTSALHSVRQASARTCPIGLAWIGSNYGMSILEYSTDHTNIPIYSYGTSYSHSILHAYFEAVGPSFVYDKKKRLINISSEGSSRITINDGFLYSADQSYFYDENETICQAQNNYPQSRYGVIRSLRGDMEKLYPYNVNNDINIQWSVTLNENSPADYSVSVKGFPANDNTITFDFKDFSALHRNQFSVHRFYVHYKGGVGSSDLKIGLSANMITAGYTISGGVDNVYTIPFAPAGTTKLITVLLHGKTFVITEEPSLVTSISSTSTDTQYPTAKCVYDLIGDVETLLAGV